MKLKELSPAENLFMQFCQAYKARDLKAVLSLLTKNINMWGSGLDECRSGLKEAEIQFKRDWSQSEKAAIEVLSFVPTDQNALWAAALCKARLRINGQDHVVENLRGTLVIEKEDGQWKIAHMHASFPDERNSENSSFPVG